ncbi:uncharacterized protein KGF55_005308 [Candida pseudojiufengensis]|uniref:uncharacterized protein n=1 Tax=Candida pseudojiufengensis TaxID=497109 RepID=UPI002225A4C4|nr:uncharacterized protein KGF55_005308 [Candida pseudojiufengensis]KAI5959480.1 hypothetical protein KGF55_005308 [Candida pseudojiufengensis]
MSRRHRLLELAKNTRDNYVPRISTSVNSLATNASRVFINNPDVYDEDGNLILPKDTTIQLYPTYTRQQRDKYLVDVSGLVFAPGAPNRKNRLIMSAINKVIKEKDNFVAEQEIVELENDNKFNQEVFNASRGQDSDTESISSSDSNRSSILNQSYNGTNSPIIQDRIKERLAGFLAKSVANAHLKISIGSENSNEKNITEHEIISDKSGNFETTIEVNYKPSIIIARSVVDETIFKIGEVMIIPNSGLGIISDIDDTIKHTGITGSRKIIMKNLLTGTIDSWSIKNIINWYKNLYSKDVNFFYVSNSPWQLFDCIYEYIDASKLPHGSIHLKKYFGNIMSIILEPSQSRKRKTLHKILTDFPDKKFICIGDSGEVDLEAYVDLAVDFPNQVSKIYIRVVSQSLSDMDDNSILDQIRYLIDTWKLKKSEASRYQNIPKPSTPPREETPDLIDLSDPPPARKFTPIKPAKPSNLKGNAIDKTVIPINHQHPPTSSNVASDGSPINGESEVAPPPLPQRKRTYDEEDQEFASIFDTQGFKDLEIYDRKGSQWIRRIIEALLMLRNTNTTLEIFMDDDNEFFKKSCDYVKELNK